ncbi:MAG TPA: cupredoxin domain-containing protein [Candidatus Paceibacterota bacterium]|nr:cupredoxin domain-containing protein [Candidatus Paceibacterota bacterium]
MRPLLFVLAATAVTALPHLALAHSASTTEEHVIEMRDGGFSPTTMTIETGETVIFEAVGKDTHWPASNNHPTHTVYPGSSIEKCGTADADVIFDACRGLEFGEKYEFTFAKPGTWRFHDHLHAQFGGTITVTRTDAVASSTAERPSVFGRIQQWFENVGALVREAAHSFEHWIKSLKPSANSVAADSKDIFTNDDALRSYLQKHGAVKTIAQLHALETKLGSCHQPAHRAGHISYELFGDKAFIEYSAYCQSGYYHGVMEQYLQDHGTENLGESLSKLCKSDLNDFFAHQCVHGIGHGIMAWTNYDLPAALTQCDALPLRKESCWTGVFMENLGAQLAKNDTTAATTSVGETDIHYTRFLSDDPQYPCNAVTDLYKGSCYFLQTSRMMQLFDGDFKKVAQTCAVVPETYQVQCFGSMGRDVGGRFPTDNAKQITQCGYVQNDTRRIDCLNGAVQNSFWDPSGADQSLAFCKLLTDSSEKSACYTTIFQRAPEVIADKSERRAFCEKAEESYRALCTERME